jgi:hypothetical protein
VSHQCAYERDPDREQRGDDRPRIERRSHLLDDLQHAEDQDEATDEAGRRPNTRSRVQVLVHGRRCTIAERP